MASSSENPGQASGDDIQNLRILHLEDAKADAELVERFLKRSGMSCEIQVVATKTEFEKAIKDFSPHVILSDHSLPQFDSIDALKIARAALPDVAFILVTGTVSEEFAVTCIRNGADDYILKSNLIRLPTAILSSRKEKLAWIKLRESEESYRQIVETAQEGIWMFDQEGKTEFANKKMATILGYSVEELITKHGSDLTPANRELIKHKMASGSDEPIVVPAVTKNNLPIWLQVRASQLSDRHGNRVRILAMVTDITEQKNAYEKLVQSEKQIRNFASHLNKTMEAERARIAREIHDELGQQLAGIKMSLGALKRLPDAQARAEKISATVNDVDAAIQVMRKIATELRPGILDTLGLIPSLEWLAGEFERKTGVKCDKHLDVSDSKFDNEISICFFRVCQESLTNITKHAQATKVRVEVTQKDNELRMLIADNGKGIAGEELDNPFSMGLLGMRERARLAGANLQLQSSPNKGTTVELTAVLKNTPDTL